MPPLLKTSGSQDKQPSSVLSPAVGEDRTDSLGSLVNTGLPRYQQQQQQQHNSTPDPQFSATLASSPSSVTRSHFEAAHSPAHETTEAPVVEEARPVERRSLYWAGSGVQSDPVGNQVLDLRHCVCSDPGPGVFSRRRTELHTGEGERGGVVVVVVVVVWR
ncbi:unnamed protein product [Pleuronectes platessa]|uniref:Uncharacterized protein n=1 Tax=Pleuronectes platessa TaxID=8262 RepID=A0A9N7TTQ7_PLEPL|nr:unnamed protein product [Pleuronectes platessa]